MSKKNFRASWIRTLAGPTLLSAFLLWSVEDDNVRSELMLYILVLWVFAAARFLYIFLRVGVETYIIEVEGFTINRWKGKVPWQNVQRVLSYPTPLNKYICFMLKDGSNLRSNRPWPSGLLDRWNSQLGRGEVWLSTTLYQDEHADMLNATFDAFCEAVPEVIREETECRMP